MLMQLCGCYRPMLIAVRGIQPGKRDPVQPPCGRCRGVGVRLQVSGPYEILQATVEIMRGSVHAEALGPCHRVHATACRGVPQLSSHRLQQLHGLGAHVTSRTLSSTTVSVRAPETLPYRDGVLPSLAPPRPSRALLAAPCWRTVFGGGRRAPVRPLRAAGAPHPSLCAAYSPPFRGGYVRCRALRGALPTRR